MTGQGLAVHPLVVLFCRWLRFGTLRNGLTSAGLSCCSGYTALSTAYWYVGGRIFG